MYDIISSIYIYLKKNAQTKEIYQRPITPLVCLSVMFTGLVYIPIGLALQWSAPICDKCLPK